MEMYVADQNTGNVSPAFKIYAWVKKATRTQHLVSRHL